MKIEAAVLSDLLLLCFGECGIQRQLETLGQGWIKVPHGKGFIKF